VRTEANRFVSKIERSTMFVDLAAQASGKSFTPDRIVRLFESTPLQQGKPLRDLSMVKQRSFRRGRNSSPRWP
jgi:hypothetical protein